MDTLAHLRQLFEYNDWANRRIIAAIRRQPSQRCLAIVGHLLITESEYFKRLHGKDSTGFDFWPALSIDECSTLAHENAEHFENLLSGFDDEGLGLHAAYKTSEGVPHTNTFRELLTHVLMHSATHRGNIVIRMRDEGLEPPVVDYIIYLRENVSR